MKIANLVSGGVDSSVALYLTKQMGYDPTAFFIKIWMEDDFGTCPWEEDLRYAESITKKLGVKLEVVSMQKEYWDKIINYTISTVKQGLTPNPDVFCNTFIKFGLFDEKYGKEFDKIATGHYARIESKNQKSEVRSQKLMKAEDPAKDQAYFLSQLSQDQINRALFPIGDLLKTEVRQIAKDQGLETYNRPDSQGLCFLGKVNFRDFLKRYVGERLGEIIDIDTGKTVGEHEGHWFYTIGQREGLKIGGLKEPYYVVGKRSQENVILVGKGHQHPQLWQTEVYLTKLNIFSNLEKDKSYTIQLRYHGQIVKITNWQYNNKTSILDLDLAEKSFAITSGQVGVIYDQDQVIASGIIK